MVNLPPNLSFEDMSDVEQCIDLYIRGQQKQRDLLDLTSELTESVFNLLPCHRRDFVQLEQNEQVKLVKTGLVFTKVIQELQKFTKDSTILNLDFQKELPDKELTGIVERPVIKDVDSGQLAKQKENPINKTSWTELKRGHDSWLDSTIM